MADYSSAALQPKTAIYIRVSTQFQIDKDSLQVQRRELIAYSELVLGIKDYYIFEDPGYSGKNTDRPAYQSMMNRLRSGEFSHLLVWKIDRISRNLLDFATMYAELKKIGVTFVSKNEQFDTSTAIGEAMLKIILVFAELERQMTAERVTAVMLSRANNGQWNGGRIPFGYDWDKETKTFSINKKEAAEYHLMCDLYEEHQSLIQVCSILNQKGITTKTGGPWNPTSLRKVLTNVFYMGTYRYNVRLSETSSERRDESEWINVEDHHPALIDDVRFNRLTFLLSRNVRRGPKKGDTLSIKAVHIFAGLIICGNCGCNMTATQDRRRADGWRPSMYGCSARRKKTKECTNKFVSDCYVAPVVFSAITSILKARGASPSKLTSESFEKELLKSKDLSDVKHISGLEEIVSAIQSNDQGIEFIPKMLLESTDYNQEYDLLKNQKARYETALQRLRSLYMYGDEAMPEKDYLIERKQILSELEKVDKRLSEIKNTEDGITDNEFRNKASYFIMVDKLLNYKAGDAEKLIRSLEPSIIKSFMKQVIDHIVIKDGVITEIHFKSRLSMRFIYE